MSFMGARAMHPRQVPCWITHTNERTHEIIRGGLDRSPLFTGVIKGVGPRYCPSIEDKVVRFAERTSHQIFLEPEGLATNEIYPNGISTSLPFDVQMALVRSMKGCEQRAPAAARLFDRVRLLRSARAALVARNESDPRSLFRRADQRHDRLRGSGGARACWPASTPARHVRGEAGWCPRRDEAYLGVLVDDLVTRGVSEPYRMFTSRAEYRLQLREDNADLRLTEAGRALGVVDDARWDAFARKRDAIAREQERLKSTSVNPNVVAAHDAIRVLGAPIERDYTLADLLRRPGVTYASLMTLPGAGAPVDDRIVAEQVEIAAKYSGYIDRQRDEIERQRAQEDLRLPADLDYRTVRGFSTEVQQKLNLHKPETIGQAARISGITPAAISLLLVHLKRGFAVRTRSARTDGAAHRVIAAIDLDDGLARAGGGGRRAAAGSARQARRLSRAAREMEPHVQPDRDPRARSRWSRITCSTRSRCCRICRRRIGLRVLDVGSGGGVPGIAARDRAAAVDGRAHRQQPQEGRVPAAGGDRARARQRRSGHGARRGLRAGRRRSTSSSRARSPISRRSRNRARGISRPADVCTR